MPRVSLSTSPIVEVTALSGFDKALAYRVPPKLVGLLQLGMLVRIPLRGRTELGIVTALSSQQVIAPERVKLMYDCVQEQPVLTEDLMALYTWALNYYIATPESMFEAMIPAAIRRGMRSQTRLYLSVRQPPSPEALQQLKAKAPRQAELWAFLSTQLQALPRREVLKRLKLSAGVCDALLAKGWIQQSACVEQRDAYADSMGAEEATAPTVPPQLTEEQQRAGQAIHAALQQTAFSVRLLHGVTGSGKTEVYLYAIESVIARGGGIIFLVPEVALAPQTVGRVRARLQARGVKTVVWHSHLSDGERHDAWNALSQGEAQIVVGARSAVFAPVKNLQLIIVDEEHEPSYKQEEAPRYNGRDVAVYRARICDAVCILGSATPSMESLRNVELGKYAVDRLLKRVDHRELPKIHIVDLSREQVSGKSKGPLSRLLAEKLRDRFSKREQSILFINRRGFSTNLFCPDCGYVAGCDDCSIPKTYHRIDRSLHCHLCGSSELAPKVCPQCGSSSIQLRGQGTQKIEDVVQQLLPKARIVRMDADSMSKKNLYRTILNDFRIGKIDILVGTQMIAKGLDFPNVTLVGLVDADRSLHVEDFRAAERTFQLVVQVSGRAGRGDRAGEVVIQTHTPHVPPIHYARRSDFDGFQQDELAQRKEFMYPPYRHLIRHLFRGRNPDKVVFYIEQWTKLLEQHLDPRIEIRGPAVAPIEKIRGEYRYQLWYFTPQVSQAVSQLTQLRANFKMDRQVFDLMDVDPMNLS